MCDLRRLHVRSASCSRCSSRAAAAGARCRAAARLWRAAAAVGSAPADAAREPGHPQMVAGQAAGKLPYATTWWLLDAVARHATAASSDFFCVPFGGRANGRVSTPRPTPSPTTAAPAPSMRTAPTAARASRLFAHVRRDVQLGIRRRLRRRWPRLGFRPARADSMWDRTIVSCGNKSDSCVYMT